jgi:membrane fusion protein (multidrug efflux system)
MQSQQPTPSSQSTANPWLRRIWAALPTLAVIVLVGVIVVLGAWIKSQGEIIKTRKAGELRQEEHATNVVALQMIPGPVSDRISLPGLVRPWLSLNVVAEVRGKIVAKEVAEGQVVSKGHLLARIDDRDYQNAHSSTRAAYRAAKAALDRISALYRDKLATQSQLDDAVALVETTQAAMDTAALNLERCTIRSPFAGVVNSLPIEVGQFMNSGDPVADLLQMDRLKVEVGIPESDVAAVRSVQNYRITIDALDGAVFEGRYHFLSKSTDSKAMLYKLEIALENSNGAILPDMFARVEIVKRRVAEGLTVPLYSLVTHNDQQAVFVAENGIARKKPVTLGIQEGWRIQLTGGVQPGEAVIVVGQRGLNDGDTINVVRSVDSLEELDQ